MYLIITRLDNTYAVNRLSQLLLMYLIITRLDITYAVNQLNQFVNNLRIHRYQVASHLLKFLKVNPS